MKDINEVEFVCATPVIVSRKGKVKIGESTIVAPEKNLIVVKKQGGTK